MDDGEGLIFNGVRFSSVENPILPKVLPLKISNWNVNRVLPKQDRFARIQIACRAWGSDIWFLTETHEEMKPNSDFYSIFSGTPDRSFEEGERWSSIWSRWPIDPLDEYVTDKSRCVAGRIENSTFGELILYGLVLPWTTDPRGKEIGSFEVYKQNLRSQQSDWYRIRAAFPKAVLIVAGDFNQSLAQKHYYGSHDKRAILEGVLEECGLIPLTSEANDPIYRDSPPNACIDHICISTGGWDLEATSRWPNAPTLKEADSDHFLVSVQIS